jgi:hypothetical protein
VVSRIARCDQRHKLDKPSAKWEFRLSLSMRHKTGIKYRECNETRVVEKTMKMSDEKVAVQVRQ